MELAAADQFGVGDFLRRIAGNRNHAVADAQTRRIDAKFLGRFGEQHAARFHARNAQGGAGKAHAGAA